MFAKKNNEKIIFFISKDYAIVSVIKNSAIIFSFTQKMSESIDFFQQIKDCLSRIPQKNNKLKLIVILSSDKVQLRFIKIPDQTKNIKNTIYWELKKFFENTLNNLEWNFKKINSSENEYKVELVSKNLLNSIKKNLKQTAFLKKSVIISEETALENILNFYKPDATENVYFFINFDFYNINLILIQNNQVKYKRLIDDISTKIIEEIILFYNIDFEQLTEYYDEIKIFPYASSASEIQTDEKYNIFISKIKSLLNQFINEIKKTESFAKQNLNINSELNKYFINGDLIKIDGIVKMLNIELNKTVEKYIFPGNKTAKNNFQEIFCNLNVNGKNSLLLNEANKNISYEYEDENLYFKNPFIYIAGLFLFLSLIFLPNYSTQKYRNIFNSYEELNNKIIEKNNILIQQLNKKNFFTIPDNLKKLIDITNYKHSNTLKTLSKTLNPGIMLNSVNIKTFSKFPIKTVLKIEGWSSAPILLPKFIIEIDKTNLFKNINLEYSKQEKLNNFKLTHFEITAEFKEGS